MRGLVVAVALCALLAGGCGGGSGDSVPAASPETAPPEASNRPAAPALAGVTLDGERISLTDLRGRAVFVNVWSSW